ncbi:hypothetical protein ZYGR_0U02060 [Zygosaccharomyces rouxii]|uniref:ZYRO0F13354p n=2 Tax=Zygosaccharomyces rouxii TaxID=4956 RepID=C5DYI7_ZYGRC|nr:uncharacterized protein ZYRO0F13354g [Zygosaccharomyces rouxii]KAH9199605.1 caffeine-induced death protein 2-domain-containing protein [Zygosaccharomyces rouxii]GAV50350.1 hypothetical protein ZYGR_0U02060 [Zygosaccharomyces rouxii]CAR28848.1 ZYRO0F13354p [Zygosaccharomyces rouxii]
MPNNEITVTAPSKLSLDANTVFNEGEGPNNRLTVTRERCINPSLIDSFLSSLRHGTDDMIKQRMSTYDRTNGARRFSAGRCDQFLAKELYPNWSTRDQVLGFCENEMNQMKSELLREYGDESSMTKKSQLDSRIDPYASKDQLQERDTHFGKLTRLQTWLDNHKKVESIVRSNSDRVLKNICDENANYLEQFWKFGQEH